MLSNEDGFYIARYISEKPPENIGYEQARPTLLEAFHERWQQQQFAEYTSNLMKAHEVVAYFERLSLTEPEP